MLTDEQRERIITVAKSWYGTPYHGNTCLKGVGCDCGQLLFGVYVEAGFVPGDAALPQNYSLQVGLHRDDTTYIDTIRQFAREIPESEVKPADLVVYRFGRGFHHGAIIVDWPTHIIHSLDREGVHAGHGMNLKFARRKKIFLTLKDEYC